MKAVISDEYDWEIGRRHADEDRLEAPAGAAACRKGFFGTCAAVGYEETVVLVPAGDGRRASLGIAPLGKHSAMLATEGVNDAGLACCVRDICVKDKGATSGTAPGKDRLSASMAVRFLLDSADSVSDAVRMLSEKDLYCSGGECHLLLCDKSRSAAIEFIDDRMTVTYGSDVLAGFYVSGFETEADLGERACGLAEFRALEEGLPAVDDAEDMASLMSRAGSARVSSYDIGKGSVMVLVKGERYEFSLRCARDIPRDIPDDGERRSAYVPGPL
ncbi:MAG: hypothetical protein IKQ60_10545 [Candidatus Methanomethylophilaceae archaeon]|nr:hypothetical protein [Candidatus Methanomethylophilaceae archaeon]